MRLSKVSLLTGKEHTKLVDLDPDLYFLWEAIPKAKRPLIQDEFPHLSVEDREFIMTGVTTEEWEEFFGVDYE